MRIIIAGSRTISDYSLLCRAIQESGFVITQIISGMSRGPDRLSIRYGVENKIPIIKVFPDWKTYGKQAGFIRNEQMAKIADGLIAIWNGYSKGTYHMIRTAEKKGLKVYITTVVYPELI